jgi:hypothetical protein
MVVASSMSLLSPESINCTVLCSSFFATRILWPRRENSARGQGAAIGYYFPWLFANAGCVPSSSRATTTASSATETSPFQSRKIDSLRVGNPAQPIAIRENGTPTMLAEVLTNQLGHYVRDRTGFKGVLDFTLEWRPDSASSNVPDADTRASIFTGTQASGPTVWLTICLPLPSRTS